MMNLKMSVVNKVSFTQNTQYEVKMRDPDDKFDVQWWYTNQESGNAVCTLDQDEGRH
jgi:hypothetical protein